MGNSSCLFWCRVIRHGNALSWPEQTSVAYCGETMVLEYAITVPTDGRQIILPWQQMGNHSNTILMCQLIVGNDCYWMSWSVCSVSCTYKYCDVYCIGKHTMWLYMCICTFIHVLKKSFNQTTISFCVVYDSVIHIISHLSCHWRQESIDPFIIDRINTGAGSPVVRCNIYDYLFVS